MWFSCPVNSKEIAEEQCEKKNRVNLGASPEPAEIGTASPTRVQWCGEEFVRCQTGLAELSPLVLLVDATEVGNRIRGRIN